MIWLEQSDQGLHYLLSRSSLIRVYTVCHSVSCTNYSVVKQYCSSFRVITKNFWVSEILGFYGIVLPVLKEPAISDLGDALRLDTSYRKVPIHADTQNIYCNHSKIWSMWLYHRVISPNDADWMANSVAPDQTAPLGAIWSGSTLFVQAYLSENLGPLRVASGHETCLCHMRTTKTQISLGIRAVDQHLNII